MALHISSGGRGQQLLAAVTATGASNTYDLETVHATFVIQSVVTGAPSGVSLKLQGSMDGQTFYDLATSTSTTGDAQFAVDKPARYIRANLGTLTGGTTPTVSAFVGAA